MANNDVFDNGKRFAYGLPDNETKKDENYFARYCMKIYDIESYWNTDLAKYFWEDFISFTVNDFKMIDCVTHRRLRKLLRGRDVYCEKRMGLNIADALFKTAQENPPWQKEDPKSSSYFHISPRSTIDNIDDNQHQEKIKWNRNVKEERGISKRNEKPDIDSTDVVVVAIFGLLFLLFVIS